MIWGFSPWSPVEVVYLVHWLNPRETEEISRKRYRWRWVAALLEPSGFHLRTILGRSCFLEFRRDAA